LAHSPYRRRTSPLRQALEYWVVRLGVAAIGLLPRRAARAVGAALGALVYRLLPRLRRVGEQNLALAYPDTPPAERSAILRGVYRSLGWQLAEFCKMSRLTPEQASQFIRYEGLENYLAARDRGQGVLVLTGHLGAWELSSFYHSLMGHPMGMVIRRLDNPRVDAFVNALRCRHGNRVLHKDDFARGLLTAMHRGETVGILMDTNMTPPQGVFVPFFGTEACTATALARIALKTNAAVLPGFLVWEPGEREGGSGRAKGSYVLHFGPELALSRTADPEADILASTARCTATIESWIRRYPDQWLWVHRRWKTRPEGERKIYR
jgi:KDO2-lipid IV(A) lauroyltransferase